MTTSCGVHTSLAAGDGSRVQAEGRGVVEDGPAPRLRCGSVAAAYVDAGRAAASRQAPGLRTVPLRCYPAYVSNSATFGVPFELLILKVILVSEVRGMPMTPAPLPEARTAPVL
ncbi:hypothetical protein GA0070614_6084 [Micromonospora coxensis]|uniref:Uncharacterized protein n=1 Tax=Micromonospora coxensis TaxID=356852 RepID=A0A1C5K3L9_9ACTN|nr:hypothetical protein GA0070614_0014 [Micromonospora coxensis]SCG77129.1 hypothetical protein GA0070614_6084 [Micromonospora coxensis]